MVVVSVMGDPDAGIFSLGWGMVEASPVFAGRDSSDSSDGGEISLSLLGGVLSFSSGENLTSSFSSIVFSVAGSLKLVTVLSVISSMTIGR